MRGGGERWKRLKVMYGGLYGEKEDGGHARVAPSAAFIDQVLASASSRGTQGIITAQFECFSFTYYAIITSTSAWVQNPSLTVYGLQYDFRHGKNPLLLQPLCDELQTRRHTMDDIRPIYRSLATAKLGK